MHRPFVCSDGLWKRSPVSNTGIYIRSDTIKCSTSNLCNLQGRKADDYRLRYRDPRGCSPNSCRYFMGIDTNAENKSYLDFYLVGQTRGWVALGFGKTDGMVSFKNRPIIIVSSTQHYLLSMQRFSDVLGCSVYEEGVPMILDSYNPKDNFINEMDDSEMATNGNPVRPTQLLCNRISYFIEHIAIIPQEDIVEHSKEYVDGHIICM